jgi:hypothetical protein
MSNFNSFCDQFGLMNLATIRGNGSAAKFLIISLQDAQLRKSRGVDFCMLFDCKDPSVYERSHCLLFGPSNDPQLNITKGDILFGVFILEKQGKKDW